MPVPLLRVVLLRVLVAAAAVHAVPIRSAAKQLRHAQHGACLLFKFYRCSTEASLDDACRGGGGVCVVITLASMVGIIHLIAVVAFL